MGGWGGSQRPACSLAGCRYRYKRSGSMGATMNDYTGRGRMGSRAAHMIDRGGKLNRRAHLSRSISPNKTICHNGSFPRCVRQSCHWPLMRLKAAFSAALPCPLALSSNCAFSWMESEAGDASKHICRSIASIRSKRAMISSDANPVFAMVITLIVPGSRCEAGRL